MPGITQITVAPTSDALTSLDAAKSELNLTTYTDDQYIAGLIERASGVIARYTGRTFGLQTIVETFRLPVIASVNYLSVNIAYPQHVGAYRPLILTNIPVTSITSVVENSVTLVNGTDYEVETETGLLYRLSNGYRLGWAYPLVVVTYQAGYVLPQDTGTRTLPYVVEDACLALVRSAYFARGQDASVIREMVEGVGRVDYALASPISAMRVDDQLAMNLASFVARVW